MSVRIMSAIFETRFKDLKDGGGHTTKASTLKLVLLALADHASDDGQGAYPSLRRLQMKTAFTRRCIINVLDALKFNGMIELVGRSSLNTNQYTILVQAFPVTGEESEDNTLSMLKPVHQEGESSSPAMVNSVHQGGESSTPAMVNPVHLNHPLTTNQPDKRYTGHPDFSKVWSEIGQLCGSVAPQTALLIDIWLEKHKLERVLEAIQETRQRGARSVQYVNQVLMTWEQHGYPPTREQLMRAREFKPTKGKSNGTDQTRSRVPEYTEADLAAAAEASRMFAVQRARVVQSRAASGTP